MSAAGSTNGTMRTFSLLKFPTQQVAERQPVKCSVHVWVDGGYERHSESPLVAAVTDVICYLDREAPHAFRLIADLAKDIARDHGWPRGLKKGGA